jgi:hypothetical protein
VLLPLLLLVPPPLLLELVVDWTLVVLLGPEPEPQALSHVPRTPMINRCDATLTIINSGN